MGGEESGLGERESEEASVENREAERCMRNLEYLKYRDGGRERTNATVLCEEMRFERRETRKREIYLSIYLSIRITPKRKKNQNLNDNTALKQEKGKKSIRGPERFTIRVVEREMRREKKRNVTKEWNVQHGL